MYETFASLGEMNLRLMFAQKGNEAEMYIVYVLVATVDIIINKRNNKLLDLNP